MNIGLCLCYTSLVTLMTIEVVFHSAHFDVVGIKKVAYQRGCFFFFFFSQISIKALMVNDIKAESLICFFGFEMEVVCIISALMLFQNKIITKFTLYFFFGIIEVWLIMTSNLHSTIFYLQGSIVGKTKTFHQVLPFWYTLAVMHLLFHIFSKRESHVSWWNNLLKFH